MLLLSKILLNTYYFDFKYQRSIRHNGKSIKLLINKGILTVHSPLCECGTATPSSIKIGKLDMHQYSEGENCISSLHKVRRPLCYLYFFHSKQQNMITHFYLSMYMHNCNDKYKHETGLVIHSRQSYVKL